MRITEMSDRLIYVPRQIQGLSDYGGISAPSKEVEELIGDEGIQYIRDKLHSIIEFKKEIHGDSDLSLYGLAPEQVFFDLKERLAIKVRDLIQFKRKHVPFNDYYNQINEHPCDYSLEVESTKDSDLKTSSNIQVYEGIKSGIMPGLKEPLSAISDYYKSKSGITEK